MVYQLAINVGRQRRRELFFSFETAPLASVRELRDAVAARYGFEPEQLTDWHRLVADDPIDLAPVSMSKKPKHNASYCADYFAPVPPRALPDWSPEEEEAEAEAALQSAGPQIRAQLASEGGHSDVEGAAFVHAALGSLVAVVLALLFFSTGVGFGFCGKNSTHHELRLPPVSQQS